MNYFGRSSKEELETLCPEGRAVADLALRKAFVLGRDFTVLQCKRDTEEQVLLYRQGNSKLNGTSKRSYHQGYPLDEDLCRALDFAPYVTWPIRGRLIGTSAQTAEICKATGLNPHQVWERIAREYTVIWTCFKYAAFELGSDIISGQDWNSNNSTFDNKFEDLGHIQFMGTD